MRRIAAVALLAGALLAAACNTVRGVGRDVKSVGSVFTGNNQESNSQ